MKKLLPFFLLFAACSNQTVRQAEAPVSENIALSSKVKKDVRENFNMTSWYRYIKNVSVKGDTIEVSTDLTPPDQSARTICGAVSGLYYAYGNATRNEALKLYGQNNKLLLERNGISNQCR